MDELADVGLTNRQLGERLRNIRLQQGLTLQDVAERSGGTLNASVVGSYERGERALSVGRLQQVLAFYRIPITELLPQDRPNSNPGERPIGSVSVDLMALEAARQHEPALFNYITSVQTRRGDYNGQVLTLRSSDLETLAATLNENPAQMRSRMFAAGILR